MGIAKQRREKQLAAKRALREAKPVAASYKYLITLAYDGSRYGGYAKQKHKNTIQNVLEAALSKYFDREIQTTESSRTDAKVHALDQKVMFSLPQKIAPAKVMGQLNELLPADIVIKNLEPVAADFHCRYQVANKTYEYTIVYGTDPRQNHYAWRVDKPLDVSKMQAESICLLGTHDFSTFKSAKATTETSVRTVNFVEIFESGQGVTVRINADGFLYNMVRLIVKALVDVGCQKEGAGYVKGLLERQNKPDNLESAPAQGLCLMEINY